MIEVLRNVGLPLEIVESCQHQSVRVSVYRYHPVLCDLSDMVFFVKLDEIDFVKPNPIEMFFAWIQNDCKVFEFRRVNCDSFCVYVAFGCELVFEDWNV